MEEFKDGRMEGKEDEGLTGRTVGWKNVKMEEYKDGRMKEYKDGRMEDRWEIM